MVIIPLFFLKQRYHQTISTCCLDLFINDKQSWFIKSVSSLINLQPWWVYRNKMGTRYDYYHSRHSFLVLRTSSPSESLSCSHSIQTTAVPEGGRFYCCLLFYCCFNAGTRINLCYLLRTQSPWGQPSLLGPAAEVWPSGQQPWIDCAQWGPVTGGWLSYAVFVCGLGASNKHTHAELNKQAYC